MGFKRPIYVLEFEGTYNGLVVKAKGASLGLIVELQSLMTLGAQLMDAGEEAQQRRDRLITIIGEKLISWNLTEDATDADGNPILDENFQPVERPVPCTVEALKSEDWQMVIYIARAWIRGAVGVNDDLGKDSNSGVPSEVVNTPMEVL